MCSMVMTRNILIKTCAIVSTLAAVGGADGQAHNASLADYFGFDGLELIKIGEDAGPITVADMNGDGLNDLIAVNNHVSRIEVHVQKHDAAPDATWTAPPDRPNELPEHWRFDREEIAVTHQVQAVVPHDFTGDGRLDLIYAGRPSEIVFLKQTSSGTFETAAKHMVRNINANRDGLTVADVLGDEAPELLALVGGEIHIWTLRGDSLVRPPMELAAGDDMVAFKLEDFDGDRNTDIVGVIPNHDVPLRLWLGRRDNGERTLSAQIRFEYSKLREFETIRLRNDRKAKFGTIARATNRVVISELTRQSITEGGEAALRVHAFTDPGNRQRDVLVIDANGDGLLDLVATDTEANTLVLYPQTPGKGLQSAQPYPSFAEVTALAGGNVDDDKYAELFVLSEEESVVGRAEVTADGISYPTPLRVAKEYEPVALNLVHLQRGPHAAVVTKKRREYAVELIAMNGERQTIEIGSQSRAPETVLALDADNDDRTDLLLFTPDKPMIMLRATDDGFDVVESDAMGQFGLVKAAQAENTAVHDVDGDGTSELLIADRNYVRAVRYVPQPQAGVSPGWQVVTQINALDSSSDLVSLALLDERIVAADSENDRLIMMSRDDHGVWRESDSVAIKGFSFDSIHAGSFTADDKGDILAIGREGFAVVRLTGTRLALRQMESWRSESENRVEHEMSAGDVNGDGFTDLIVLDAGEQMCEIFTFTDSKDLLFATSFAVFESRLFTSGQSREYQPSQAVIADMTGDGANDLLMLAHDRVLLYPQMTADVETEAEAEVSRRDRQ